MLDSAPGFGTIQGGITNNRYNEIEREGVLMEIHEEHTLDDTLAFSHAMLEPVAYVCMGNGTCLIKAPLFSREEVHQGAVKSSWFFAINMERAFKYLHQFLAPRGVGVMAIINDNYVMGPPAVIFPTNDPFAENLKKVGLQLWPAKSKCFVNEAHRDDRWDRLRGSIPNGTITDNSGTKYNGFTVYNVPIGQREYVTELRHKKIIS